MCLMRGVPTFLVLSLEFPGPWGIWAEMPRNLKWSGRLDLNQRLLGPEPSALARLSHAPTKKHWLI